MKFESGFTLKLHIHVSGILNLLEIYSDQESSIVNSIERPAFCICMNILIDGWSRVRCSIVAMINTVIQISSALDA